MTAGVWRLGAAALWLWAATCGPGLPASARAPFARAAARLAEAPLARRRQPDESLSVVSYDAHLRMDIDEARVSGTVAMAAFGRGGPGDTLRLDSGDLIVDAITSGGEAVPFSTADHHVDVRFPRAIRDGERRQLSVTYHGQPRYGLRFFSSEQQAYTAFSTSQWLVCVDAPIKATLRLSVDVPGGLTAVGSGKAVARTNGCSTHLDLPVRFCRWPLS